MDVLTVRNFGPIKDITINVNDINIFIGPTSSGKSTVAKLIAIFTCDTFLGNPTLDVLKELMKEYTIDFLNYQSFLEYRKEVDFWKVENGNLIFKNEGQSTYSNIMYSNLMLKLESSKMLNVFEKIVHSNEDLLKSNLFQTLESSPEEVRTKTLRWLFDSTIKEFSSESESGATIFEPIYVPAERILIPTVGDSLFSLMHSKTAISSSLLVFGSKYEIARRELQKLNVPFLNAQYEYVDNSNSMVLSDGSSIKLENASSGMQSVIPMMLVIEYFSQKESYIDNCFVIEEPESNLYPDMQKSLMEFIVSRTTKPGNRLIITTHSPYTFTSLDNLIQANNAYELHPESKEEIAKVVPENLWVDYKRVSCYYFEDGGCRSTLDAENQSLGASNIDDVSEKLGSTFDKLLDLKYPS